MNGRFIAAKCGCNGKSAIQVHCASVRSDKGVKCVASRKRRRPVVPFDFWRVLSSLNGAIDERVQMQRRDGVLTARSSPGDGTGASFGAGIACSMPRAVQWTSRRRRSDFTIDS